MRRSDHKTAQPLREGVTRSNRLILPITPHTHVRMTERDKIWFKIPEECPHNCGLPRRITSHAPGCRHCLPMDGLARKRRILSYFNYKDELSGLAKKQGFTPPFQGSAVYFFIPISKRYSRKKRKAMHMQEHSIKPDLSNLIKAYEDSLLKKDEAIAQYSGMGKFWVDTAMGTNMRTVEIGSGWIEIYTNLPIYDPLTRKLKLQEPFATMQRMRELNEPWESWEENQKRIKFRNQWGMFAALNTLFRL